jgi:glycerophosphoryl diester phosphodiesterase
LAEVFEVVPAGKTVYVEIKGIGIEPLVAEALSSTGARCAAHSFDHGAIARMRALAPDVPRGILLDRTPSDVTADIEATGARDVWPDWKLIDEALVRRVHDAGARVIAWTVNSAKTAERLARLGVDGICTDDVRLLDRL